MTTKTAEHVIGACLTNLQKSYIELLEQNDVEGYAEVGRTLRHYTTNLAFISSNDDDVDDEVEEETGDFDFKP
jgi:hypothetical protein